MTETGALMEENADGGTVVTDDAVIDCSTDPPTLRPPTDEEIAAREVPIAEAEARAAIEAERQAKVDRLAELRAIGWDALSADEVTEAQRLLFEMGGT